MLDTLNAAIFAAHLNSRFTVHGESDMDRLHLPLKKKGAKKGAAQLELIEAKAYHFRAEDKTEPAHRSPFALLFRGPKSKRLQQGTYRLGHKGVGEMDVFLAPIGDDKKGALYEAVFN